MKRLADLMLFQFSRLGRVGGLGAALLLAALAVDLVQLQPLEVETAALAERNRMAMIVPPAIRASERAQESQARVPVAAAAEESLRQLFRAASQSGLSLDQGDYSISGERSGEVHRYLISLPVQGAYPAVRAFIARALNENPALALAYVEIMRDAIEDADLDVTLRFTLFLKEAK